MLGLCFGSMALGKHEALAAHKKSTQVFNVKGRKTINYLEAFAFEHKQIGAIDQLLLDLDVSLGPLILLFTMSDSLKTSDSYTRMHLNSQSVCWFRSQRVAHVYDSALGASRSFLRRRASSPISLRPAYADHNACVCNPPGITLRPCSGHILMGVAVGNTS